MNRANRVVRCTLAILLSLLLVSGSGRAVEPPAADLLAPGSWFLVAPHPADASLKTAVADDASGHGAILRLDVKVPCEPIWSIQIVRGIPAGNVVRLHSRTLIGTLHF